MEGTIMWSSVDSAAKRVDLHYLSPDPDGLRGFALLPPDSPWSHRILHSCDGLLLIMFTHRERRGGNHLQLMVVNPLARSFKLLPPYHASAHPIDRMNWSIAHDPFTYSYKVVGLALPPRGDIFADSPIMLPHSFFTHCAVFELCGGEQQPDSWKVVEHDLPSPRLTGPIIARVGRPGELHWLTQRCERDGTGFETNLLSMDILTEEFELKTVPDMPPSLFIEHGTVSSGGKLYHTRTSPESSNELEVWAMDDFNSPAWSMYYVLKDMPPAVGTASWNQLEVIGILQEGTKLIMRSRLDDQVLIYDAATKQWTKTGVFLRCIPGATYHSAKCHDAIYHVNTRRRWDEAATDSVWFEALD